MTKVQVLEKITEQINEKGLAKNCYIFSEKEPKFDGNDSFCYCAVGYLLKECGVSDEDLFWLDSVQGLDQPLSVFGIFHTQFEDETENKKLKAIQQKILPFQFDENWLDKLQALNDYDEKEEVIDYLRLAVEEEKNID